MLQLSVSKDGHSYYAALEISNVTVEDAGKYRVTAKNELGESNATISLNFDSEFENFDLSNKIFMYYKCATLLRIMHSLDDTIIATQRLFIDRS